MVGSHHFSLPLSDFLQSLKLDHPRKGSLYLSQALALSFAECLSYTDHKVDPWVRRWGDAYFTLMPAPVVCRRRTRFQVSALPPTALEPWLVICLLWNLASLLCILSSMTIIHSILGLL